MVLASNDTVLKIIDHTFNFGLRVGSAGDKARIVEYHEIALVGVDKGGQTTVVSIQFWPHPDDMDRSELGTYDPSTRAVTVRAPSSGFEVVLKVLQSGKPAFFVFNQADGSLPKDKKVVTSATVVAGTEPA